MVDASSIELFLESLKSASTILRELLGLVRGGAASNKIGEANAKILGMRIPGALPTHRSLRI